MNHLSADNLIIETVGQELEHLSEDQLVGNTPIFN